MKRAPKQFLAFALCCFALAGASAAQSEHAGAKTGAQTEKSKTGAQGSKTKAAAAKPKPKPSTQPAVSDDALKAEFDEIIKLDPATRVERLQGFVERLEQFIKENAGSPALLHAQELLTSARAALGDERLRSGDRAAGVELFRAAVAEAPEAMSDKLFAGVVSQLPANLYVLGERDAAFELARAVEERAKGNAQRLLLVASFYLGTEQSSEAERVAKEAVALAPDSAAAHQTLGTAYRYELRLDDASAEFARALELDPKSSGARRILAELKRATGKAEDALALYREQLSADPQDTNAHMGLVLSLFDAGRREEAEREMQSALTGEAKDLPLLVGASYWYSAHGEGARSLELAEKAVAFEPRFGWAWARIAEGRALLALKRPLEAERAFRAARRYGNFPTLDYELAAALAAAGLYDEAAEQLARSFDVRDGQVETRLAGHIEAHASDFNELLAPERRASLSQFAGASSAEEARVLKALLTFYQATRAGATDEKAAAEAAREFGSGEDEMRTYRNIYAASRLEQRNTAEATAFERAEAAIGGVEAALDLPHAPIAIFADTEEMHELRRQVEDGGAPLNILSVQRDVLSKSLRGRIEELAGWALYNQGQTAEAAVRLRRAVSVLPEDSAWWRSAEWRLGAALEASGGTRDALAAYVSSYRTQPDPTRRSVIEALYKRINNGSTKGLDELLGAAPEDAAGMSATSQPSPTSPSVETASAPTSSANPAVEAKPTPADSVAQPKAADATPLATPTPEPSPTSTPEPATTATREPSPSPTPSATPAPSANPTTEATPTPAATPSPTPESSPETESSPKPSPSPANESSQPTESTSKPTNEPAPDARTQPAATPEPTPEQKSERKQSDAGGVCALMVSEESVTIKNNGGSATFAVTIENYSGATPPRINPSTPNWADIAILAEPHTSADGAALRFTVSSTSGKTGSFVVTFASPCGKRDVTVNVK